MRKQPIAPPNGDGLRKPPPPPPPPRVRETFDALAGAPSARVLAVALGMMLNRLAQQDVHQGESNMVSPSVAAALRTFAAANRAGFIVPGQPPLDYLHLARPDWREL